MKTAICSDFIPRVTGQLQDTFAQRLLSVVVLGSLAHGGFSRRFSDIDVAVLLEQPVAGETVAAAKARIAALAPAELAQRVSLFWTVPDFSWGRLRPVDQVDLHDSGRVVWGAPLAGLAPRPTLQAVRADIAAESLDYWADHTRRFARGLPAGEKAFKEYLRCLLYPARLVLTWHTGRLAGNDQAVSYLEERAPPGLALAPIRDALACRNGRLDDARLLRYQPLLRRQHQATLSYLGLAPVNPATTEANSR